MAAIISIASLIFDYQSEDWVEYMEHSPSQKHIECLTTILTEWKNGRRVDCYSNYVPWMDLGSNPPNRAIISSVLYFIWSYCQEQMLPELNYLLVNKKTGLPGKAMLEQWIEKYGCDDGFQRYCEIRANEAKIFLDNKYLIIID